MDMNKNKKIKTCITNPELVKVGQCCEVKMNTRWMEMNTNERFVYLPGKIKEVKWYDDSKFPCVTVSIRRCAKRGNYWPLENLMILPSQIGEEVQDHINEYHIEDYKTIIFK